MPPASTPDTLALAAERFVASLRVAAGRRRRVAIDDCFDALYDSDPFAIEAADKRARLVEVLGACTSTGRLELSKARDRGRPSLPRSVRFPDTDPLPQDCGRDWPWRAEFTWAAELRLSAYEFEVLRVMQEFVRNGGAERPIVPHRERSLELFDHEKALDALVGGRLFAPDRLSLALLRCRWAPPPLAFKRVGDGDVALVVENAASYHSCVATARADGAIGVIVYGAGRSFVPAVAGIDDIPGVASIEYAGDLDAAGLAIPHAADAIAAMHSIPAVRPATRLWELLLAHGRPQATLPVAEDVALELVAWLPIELRDRASRVLIEGKRIAQEAIGTELLSGDASWCVRR